MTTNLALQKNTCCVEFSSMISHAFLFNKIPHSIIMDSLFMIVQNSRSYLINVTPTAVAPTSVIL